MVSEMKKTVYIFELLLQGIMFIISLINMIYNLIETTHAVFIRKVFPGSIYLFFVPYNRYIDEENALELVVLFVFFIISFGSLFLSARELLDDKNLKFPFTIINTLWFGFASIVPMFIALVNEENFAEYFFETNYVESYLSIVIALLQGIILIMKSLNHNKIVRENPMYAKEEFLPENFTWSAKSYLQIKRTAMGTPVIAVAIFVWCLLLKYLNINITFWFITFLYIISLISMILIFFGVIYECNMFQKRKNESLPTTDFLKKLNKIQIISIIVFIGSYFIMFI